MRNCATTESQCSFTEYDSAETEGCCKCMSRSLRVEFLLKTDSGYPKEKGCDVTVFESSVSIEN